VQALRRMGRCALAALIKVPKYVYTLAQQNSYLMMLKGGA